MQQPAEIGLGLARLAAAHVSMMIDDRRARYPRTRPSCCGFWNLVIAHAWKFPQAYGPFLVMGWADVSLCVAVYFLAKISLHRPTRKTTFARLTQSQAFSQSFRVFQIHERYDFFLFFETLFIQNDRFLYHGDQKISWWGICRWRAVNFEIHLCSSGMNSDCIWRSSISKFSASVNSDLRLGNGSLWVEIGDAEHVDRCSWKYTRVWSYQLTSDLRDVYFFGYAHVACNGRVWKQFRCLRLSQEACRAPQRLALLMDVTMVTLRRWADVGLWVAVCVLDKKILRRPKTTKLHVWHSHRQSRSH